MRFYEKKVTTLANGQVLSIPVYEFSPRDPSSRRVYIQASVHGSETQGNAVIAELIGVFKKKQPLWNVTLVPCANPIALNEKRGHNTYGRYHPVSGQNYNRAYSDLSTLIDYSSLKASHEGKDSRDWGEELKTLMRAAIAVKNEQLASYGCSYNQKLCLSLQELAVDADIVLDLHTDTESLEHLYSVSSMTEAAQDLSFPVVYQIPDSFAGAMDEAVFMPWLTAAKKLGGRSHFLAYTLELGAEESWDSALASDQAERILRFLSAQGAVEFEAPKRIEGVIGKLEQLKRYRAPCGGQIEFLKEPGVRVAEGEELARIYTFGSEGLNVERVLAKKEGLVMARIRSSTVNEGMICLQLLEDAK